jgi:hypothetical protein
VAKRRQELVKMGWLEDSTFRRETRRGCAAIVWVLTEQGRAQKVSTAKAAWEMHVLDAEVREAGFDGYENCPEGSCPTAFLCSEKGDCRTAIDDEFGITLDPCEHPSINGGVCAVCGRADV